MSDMAERDAALDARIDQMLSRYVAEHAGDTTRTLLRANAQLTKRLDHELKRTARDDERVLRDIARRLEDTFYGRTVMTGSSRKYVIGLVLPVVRAALEADRAALAAAEGA